MRMKNFLFALLFLLSIPAVAHADMSDGALTPEDEDTFRTVCEGYQANEAECTCLVRYTLGKMGEEKVRLALGGQRLIGMADMEEAERLNSEAIAKAGSEEALEAIDAAFMEANDAGVEACSH